MRLQLLKLCLFCIFFFISSVAFAADTLPSYNVGIVTDGDTQNDREILALYKKELQVLAVDEYTINFPKSMILSGQDSREGANKALAKLYKDPNVNLILTLGPISSSLVYEGGNPPKPVVAPYVVDDLVHRNTNLAFLSADQNVLAGQFAVNEARSPLLPQISIGTGGRAIDTDRAQMSGGSSPERAWTGVASGSQ